MSSETVSITRIFPSKKDEKVKKKTTNTIQTTATACKKIEKCKIGFHFDLKTCKCTPEIVKVLKQQQQKKEVEKKEVKRVQRDPHPKLALPPKTKQQQQNNPVKGLVVKSEKSQNSQCKSTLKCKENEVWNSKLCKCLTSSKSVNHSSKQKEPEQKAKSEQKLKIQSAKIMKKKGDELKSNSTTNNKPKVTKVVKKTEKTSAAPKTEPKKATTCIERKCQPNQTFCKISCQCIATPPQQFASHGGLPQPSLPEPKPYIPRPIFTLIPRDPLRDPRQDCEVQTCDDSPQKSFSKILCKCI